MGKLTPFKKEYKCHKAILDPKSSEAREEYRLLPATLSGVIAPWSENLNGGGISDYKIVTYGGIEYFVVADQQWREVLSTYCWEEVNVIGLLNTGNMTFIPQKIFPKGPTGENVVDFTIWKNNEFVKKVAKVVNEFVVVPAALWAIMAF